MKKKILSFVSVFFLGFMLTTSVSARSIAQADDSVVQEGTYDSLRIAAGNNVTNNATVDGLSIIAGNDVNANGSAPYGFVAGNNVTVNEKISKDLFVAGNNVRIGSEAVLERDVYIAANNVKVSANVARDLRVGAETVDLSGITIGGNVYIAAANVILDSETVIKGKLIYDEDAIVDGLSKANIGSVKTYKSVDEKFEMSTKDIIYGHVTSMFAAYITMLLILLLIPKVKEKLNEVKLTAGEIAKTTLIGLALLIVIPISIGIILAILSATE